MRYALHPLAQQILDGPREVWLEPGEYDGDGIVRLEGLHDRVIHTDGVVLHKPKLNVKSHESWSLSQCTWVQITGDMQVLGTKPFAGRYYPPWEGQHAFGLHACGIVSIEGAKVRDVWGDFVYLGGQGPADARALNVGIALDLDADDCGRHTISALAINQLDVRGIWSNWHSKNLGRGVDYERQVPGDQHHGVRLGQAAWLHETPDPRP